ncbi:DEKNAAC103521 [Brettanomyces naardenensis]|uniref:DEKNAAC103521 n=1 Tax=Brettanomyces naardenensis TaxID=13370 RepID=A0A448YNC2_BRENA|nr:DEKNAAC103521 [Brettanomyces naardenensis]
MALLSPPSSRYAFEPALTTSAIPPIASLLMPSSHGGIITSANNTATNTTTNSSINSTNSSLGGISNGVIKHGRSHSAQGAQQPLQGGASQFLPRIIAQPPIASLVSQPARGFGSQDDVPAFDPKTRALLQNFTTDLSTFTQWISSLQPEQQRTVIDVFLETVADEVVTYVKEKTAAAVPVAAVSAGQSIAHTQNHARPMRFSPPLSAATVQPPVRPVSPLLMLNGDSTITPVDVSGSPIFSGNTMGSPLGSPLGSPAAIPVQPVMASLSLGDPVARPRSAGPLYGLTQMPPSYGGGSTTGASSPYGASPNGVFAQPSAQPLFRVFSSDLDPTGFQRRAHDFFDDGTADAAAQQFGLTSATDFAGQNALKLNHSLNTITRKQGRQVQQVQVQHPQSQQPSQDLTPQDDRGRTSSPFGTQVVHEGQSLSVPPTSRAHGLGANSSGHSPGSVSPPSVLKSAAPQDIASKKLLENIPLWLKTLRLHKYTDNLKGLQWEKMVELDDQDLEDLGVSTVGARNKLLKSFAYVKENLHD